LACSPRFLSRRDGGHGLGADIISTDGERRWHVAGSALLAAGRFSRGDFYLYSSGRCGYQLLSPGDQWDARALWAMPSSFLTGRRVGGDRVYQFDWHLADFLALCSGSGTDFERQLQEWFVFAERRDGGRRGVGLVGQNAGMVSRSDES